MSFLNHNWVDLRNVYSQRAMANRKIVIKKPLVWMYPAMIENSYSKALVTSIANVWIQGIKEILFPRLKAIVAELRMDSVHMEMVVDRTRGFFIQVSDQKAPIITEQYAKKVTMHNKKQFEKVVQSAINVDLRGLPEQGIAEIVKTFVSRNVRLIKGLGEEVAKKLEQRIYSGIQKGYTAEEIQKSIQYRFGIDEGVFKLIKTRMELIAVDQVGKLNGQLTKYRQTSIGIKEYIWRTQRDTRVRDLHRKREGRKYKWSSPPSDGHPGEPIRCRCVAEPVFSKSTIKGV